MEPFHHEGVIQVSDPAGDLAEVLSAHSHLTRGAGWVGSPEPIDWHNMAWMCAGCREKVADLTYEEPRTSFRRHQAEKILERITQ